MDDRVSPRPRFSVGSVTGWPITASTLSDPRNQRSVPSTIWYVHDSAFGYRIVARFTPYGHRGSEPVARPEEAARAHAAKLNELDLKLRRTA